MLIFFKIKAFGFCQISLYVSGKLSLIFTTVLKANRKKRYVVIDELSKGCYSIKFSKKPPNFLQAVSKNFRAINPIMFQKKLNDIQIRTI